MQKLYTSSESDPEPALGRILASSTALVPLFTRSTRYAWPAFLPTSPSDFHAWSSEPGTGETPMNEEVPTSSPSNESRCPVGRYIFHPSRDPSHWTS